MRAHNEPVLRAINVHKAYGRNQILKGINLEVAQGDVTCLLGPSGAGKSTFLRCINHLEKTDRGMIYVDGELVGGRMRNGRIYELKDKEICGARAKMGMVFQHFNLFPHMTALENLIEGPILVKHEPREKAVSRARALLAQVGLAEKEAAYPRQLSGGQQQRVAIARALVNDPAIILADEPTGALDTKSGEEVMRILLSLNQERGTTIILVTHAPDIADHAQRTIYLRDGKVVEEKK